MRLLLALITAIFALLLCACTRATPGSTPEGAVRHWIERMEDASVDPAAAKEAFGLLSSATRQNLEARATRDAPRLGRRLAAHDMLAEGRFGLRFRPKAFRTQIDGAHATVEVRGEPGEEATVMVTREREGWRLELELPDVVPLVKRADGGI
jgi:hypothetical protein